MISPAMSRFIVVHEDKGEALYLDGDRTWTQRPGLASRFHSAAEAFDAHAEFKEPIVKRIVPKPTWYKPESVKVKQL